MVSGGVFGNVEILILFLDEMMAELEPVMKKLDPKIVSTRDNLYDYFILRARANLHIALCFSPVCYHCPFPIYFVNKNLTSIFLSLDWREVPQSLLKVSGSNFWLHHGLVSIVARRRSCRSVPSLLTGFLYRLYGSDQEASHRYDELCA